MNIEKWVGLVSAASPYSLPPGANVEQNNLQVRKPGQLTPRSGTAIVYQGQAGPVLAMHRTTGGGGVNDSLVICRFTDATNVTVEALAYVPAVGATAAYWTRDELFTVAGEKTTRPTFCQDRHGTLYTFFGSSINPKTYRYGVDVNFVRFGMVAPMVAPLVTPAGDGWFLERVDVTQSGTSYYTPPTMTVTGGNPDRNATVRAVVQAGAIVAVDVIDGGSNFRSVPTITLSNEQIGTGFQAKGTQTTSAAVYGFLEVTPATITTISALAATDTHQYAVANLPPTIAYNSGGTTAFVFASFDATTSTYTALIPMTTTAGFPGTDAFVQVKFVAIAAAYKLGAADPTVPSGASVVSSQVISTAATTKYGVRQSNGWYALDDYFENTYAPTHAGIADRFTYWGTANKDSFWGLGPYPNRYRFAKAQVRVKGITPDNWLGNNDAIQNWGNYYFPDYSVVSYKLLIGPSTEASRANEANWQTFFSTVLTEDIGGVICPYIDCPLLPAKKTDGTAYTTTTATVMPTVRVYLSYCPASWTVDNNQPFVSQNAYVKRFCPLSGQDRRANAGDTASSNINPNGTNLFGLFANPGANILKRWWSAGHVSGFSLPQPIHDFRKAGATVVSGNTVTTEAVIRFMNAGSQLERGTAFAMRFEQYNSYDYQIEETSPAYTSWINGISAALKYRSYGMARRGSFGTGYTDFYFEANSADTSVNFDNVSPGAVDESAPNAPRVTVSGRGWTALNQTASVTLRKRGLTADPLVAGSWSDTKTYTFGTSELLPASTQKTIGSVTIQSGGQNYYREPTILFRGGGGYGLKVASTIVDSRITSLVILDGGDGFTSATTLYTDVQAAKIMPVLRGTMRGTYRCAYRYADYRLTVVISTSITTVSGSKTATLASAVGVKPGMVLTWSDETTPAIAHLVKITSVSGNQITLARASQVTGTGTVEVRDMTLPIVYSDFSPIVDVDASANGSGRASTMQWSLAGVTAPPRAEYVEFYRTSADQSLVFYRIRMYGKCSSGTVEIIGVDGQSDEELFDPDRTGYAALPVVLPNGSINAYRFGNARNDMSVAVAWQDRLWYGVSTSGKDQNTVFYSEYDEFESCPNVNELPIQSNLRTTDYLTALIPFGSALVAMQTSHAYTVAYNTDPSVDAIVTLTAHRGCLSQSCWDIFDDQIYAADERGIYRMSKNGTVESLSEAVRDFFEDHRVWLGIPNLLHLRIDPSTGILRFFAMSGETVGYPNITLCLHIQNKAWWTESWPNSLTCSCDYRSPTTKLGTTIYGAFDGNIYEMAGLTDVAYRDIASVTITNPGSGYTSPPSISAGVTGSGARFRGVVQDGRLVDIVVTRGGWNYGTITPNLQTNAAAFLANVALTISGGGGSGAEATAYARPPTSAAPDANGVSVLSKATVPWSVKTGPLALINDETRGGDAQIDRSVTVTYAPTETSKSLTLREFYNNSQYSRNNVMRRDRGTGFVHNSPGSRTTLDMIAAQTPQGTATGLAKARFAGRSLTDMASADRHVAVELICEPVSANSGDPTPSDAAIFSLEVQGVVDGSQ